MQRRLKQKIKNDYIPIFKNKVNIIIAINLIAIGFAKTCYLILLKILEDVGETDDFLKYISVLMPCSAAISIVFGFVGDHCGHRRLPLLIMIVFSISLIGWVVLIIITEVVKEHLFISVTLTPQDENENYLISYIDHYSEEVKKYMPLTCFTEDIDSNAFTLTYKEIKYNISNVGILWSSTDGIIKPIDFKFLSSKNDFSTDILNMTGIDEYKRNSNLYLYCTKTDAQKLQYFKHCLYILLTLIFINMEIYWIFIALRQKMHQNNTFQNTYCNVTSFLIIGTFAADISYFCYYIIMEKTRNNNTVYEIVKYFYLVAISIALISTGYLHNHGGIYFFSISSRINYRDLYQVLDLRFLVFVGICVIIGGSLTLNYHLVWSEILKTIHSYSIISSYIVIVIITKISMICLSKKIVSNINYEWIIIFLSLISTFCAIMWKFTEEKIMPLFYATILGNTVMFFQIFVFYYTLHWMSQSEKAKNENMNYIMSYSLIFLVSIFSSYQIMIYPVLRFMAEKSIDMKYLIVFAVIIIVSYSCLIFLNFWINRGKDNMQKHRISKKNFL